MTTFRIGYVLPETDPEEWVTVIKEFEDTPGVSAEEWAEDYAYAVSDKGHYLITSIPENV